MYYIVQENVFKEENYDNLILALDRLQLQYEIVKYYPFLKTFDFKTNRKDIFPFGALEISRISKEQEWYPGSQLNDNHDYLVYKEYYRENLLNYDSKIYKFGDDFFSEEPFFARPTLDTKVFVGQVYDMETWEIFRNNQLTNGHSTILNVDTEIQVSSVKSIQNEIRFWIVKGEVVTASQYRLGNRRVLSENVDQSAYDFCKEMVKLFQLNDAFVMDICSVNNEYKIVECGCINCAGFYRADIQKLLIALENAF
jgi:hypothetical protein